MGRSAILFFLVPSVLAFGGMLWVAHGKGMVLASFWHLRARNHPDTRPRWLVLEAVAASALLIALTVFSVDFWWQFLIAAAVVTIVFLYLKIPSDLFVLREEDPAWFMFHVVALWSCLIFSIVVSAVFWWLI